MTITPRLQGVHRAPTLSVAHGRTAEGLHLTFLGTAGGPLPLQRAGTSTVLEVDGSTYVVDAGAGAVRNFGLAGLPFADVRAMFLTHMHSDHTADWFNFFLLHWNAWPGRAVDVYGPGSVEITGEDLVHAECPVPGIEESLRHHVDAHAADINLRMRGEAVRVFPGAASSGLLAAHDLPVHPHTSEDNRWPEAEPVVVHRDDNVVVSCIQVRHGEVVPAYAFRFDTAHGSVVFSGDTAPCVNLTRLAQGADVLVCEVLALEESLAWIRSRTDASALQHHFVRAHVLLDAAGTGSDEPEQPGIGVVAEDAGVGLLVLNHLVPGDGSVASEVFAERAQVGFSGPVVVAEDLHRLSLDPGSCAAGPHPSAGEPQQAAPQQHPKEK